MTIFLILAPYGAFAFLMLVTSAAISLFAAAGVCLAVIILRLNAPDLHRPFRTPWVWFVAPAGLMSCGLMAFSLSRATWIRLALWSAIGVIIYFGYGRHRAPPWKWQVTENPASPPEQSFARASGQSGIG